MNRIYLAIMAVALAVGLVFLAASVAYADGSVSIDDRVFRGAPGDVFHAGTIPAVAGDECAAELMYTNNSPEPSEHDDTDILVGPVVFTDVEHGPFVAGGLTFTAEGPVDVALRLGGDGVSSGGYLVEVTCTTTITSSTTTTTLVVLPSTTTTSTVPPVTTTTQSPPVGGVDTGGGGMALVVYGQDTDILYFGAGVAFIVAAVLGIAALAPRLRRNRRGDSDA